LIVKESRGLFIKVVCIQNTVRIIVDAVDARWLEVVCHTPPLTVPTETLLTFDGSMTMA